jgi:hypothetical protein
MEFDVLIFPDGKTIHEVTQREVGENCQNIHMFNAAGTEVVSDEQTGPDCDQVSEVN